MSKRILDCVANDFKSMDRQALLNSIKSAAGRTVMVETDVSRGPLEEGVTNAEVARAMGGDMILLNKLDFFDLEIKGLPSFDRPIEVLKRWTGVPIGANLETLPAKELLIDRLEEISPGRICSEETLKVAQDQGLDFLCFTGNPRTGVSNKAIKEAIAMARDNYKGIIIAGKMHSSGTDEAVCNQGIIESFIDAGADIILIPGYGSVPGANMEEIRSWVQLVQARGKLALLSNGSSQDFSRIDTIQQKALANKAASADIHHIGSSGYGGIAPFDNIMELSISIRGINHTIKRMASSPLR